MAARQKTGRPTLYVPSKFPTRVFKLALLGLTNDQIAVAFGVGVTTIKRWSAEHEPFRAAIARGREEADGEIAHSLYHRAKGYSHKAVKILQNNGLPVVVPYTEHYPPDTAAASLWLRNRRGDRWKAQPVDSGPDEQPPTSVPIKRTDASIPDPGA